VEEKHTFTGQKKAKMVENTHKFGTKALKNKAISHCG
jgi:hypothetical protein